MAQSYLNKKLEVDIAFLAEHRHKDKKLLEMKCAKAGWKAAIEAANEGLNGGTSAGTCMLWRPQLQGEEMVVPLAKVAKGRLAFMNVMLKNDAKILMVAVYGYTGIGNSGENFALIAEIGNRASKLRAKWWNLCGYLHAAETATTR